MAGMTADFGNVCDEKRCFHWSDVGVNATVSLRFAKMMAV